MADYIRRDRWSLTWRGDEMDWGMAWAALTAIDETNAKAVGIARSHPAWDNDTGQTEGALYQKGAEVEFAGTTKRSTPHVWGSWGVEDRPRWIQEEGDQGSVFYPSESYRERFRVAYGSDELAKAKTLTTVDVALFLEFGTVKMHKRPWLYPAWDATKGMLPGEVVKWWNVFQATGRVMSPLVPGGARPFMSFAAFKAQAKHRP